MTDNSFLCDYCGKSFWLVLPYKIKEDESKSSLYCFECTRRYGDDEMYQIHKTSYKSEYKSIYKTYYTFKWYKCY